jgi:hypothetical protein
MALWYIDALDARAGMGFATYRDADLHRGDVDLGKPAVFVGPPFFQGESVASRAIGFAAAHGSFQFGLFVDSEEIAFFTLQGVCEFIRRAYISAGGGDTDSGISPAPVVPNPEPEGGELPAMEIQPVETPFVFELLDFAGLIQAKVATISRTKQLNTREGPPSKFLSEAVSRHTHIDDLLSYGIALLIDEMMRRVPNDPAMRGPWIRSTMRLGQALVELGLLHSIFKRSAFRTLSRLAGILEERFQIFNLPGARSDHFLEMILGIGPYYLAQNYAIRTASDPMDDLSSFAIPSVIAKYVGLDPKTASARDLLSVILADPTLLLGRKPDRSQEVAVMIAAIILLSSVCIVGMGRAPVGALDGSNVAGALRKDLVRDAIIWMDSQMPAYLFHADVETCIRGASQLRYAPPPVQSRTSSEAAQPRSRVRSASA